MPIRGLINQWETYDGLHDRFAVVSDDDAQGSLIEKYRMIRELLAKLHKSTDSFVYVGTSHSTMIFGTRDAVSYMDRTQSFAFVEVVFTNEASDEYTFRVETREIHRDRPTSKWIVRKTTDTEAAAKMVREALLYADVPQRRTEAIG